MKMKEVRLTEKEARTVLAVFMELSKKPYSEVNTYLGSETIKEMYALHTKLYNWWREEVLKQTYDGGEWGWYDSLNVD